MIPKTSKLSFVFLAGILLAVFLPGAVRNDFTTRGEPREAIVSQTMLETSNWILPSGYGGVVPSKPPFSHWVMSVMGSIVGEANEFTSRSSSFLFGCLFVFLFFAFLRKEKNSSVAWIVTLVLLTSVEWSRALTTARVDMTLASLLGMYFLVFYSYEKNSLTRFPIIAPLLIAAAILTKGPVSLVLPGAISFLYLLILRYGFWKSVKINLFIFIPAVLIAFIWYYLAFLKGGQAFYDKFYYENVARFTSSMKDAPHQHTIWYLYGTIILGLIPWSILLLLTIFKTKYSLLKTGINDCIELLITNKLVLYSLLIIFSFTAFYSIPSSKRSVYLLPIYPFLTLMICMLAMRYFQTIKHIFYKSHLVLSTILIGILLSLQVMPKYFVNLIAADLKTKAKVELEFYFSVLNSFSSLEMFLLLLLPLVCWVGFIIFRIKKSQEARLVSSILAFYLSIMLLLNTGILPAVSKTLSTKNLKPAISSILNEEDKLCSFGYEFYDLSFYLNKKIFRVEDKTEGCTKVVLLTKNMIEFKSLFNTKQYQQIYTSSLGVIKPYYSIELLDILR